MELYRPLRGTPVAWTRALVRSLVAGVNAMFYCGFSLRIWKMRMFLSAGFATRSSEMRDFEPVDAQESSRTSIEVV